MIYLIDLNHTLVANSPKKTDKRIRPFEQQIEQEFYRQDLIDFLKNKYVILITARPNKYKKLTLTHIKTLTKYQAQEAYFSEIKSYPAISKEHLLNKYIFPKHGKDASQYFALESNPMTRNMYAKYGIASQSYEDFRTWKF